MNSSVAVFISFMPTVSKHFPVWKLCCVGVLGVSEVALVGVAGQLGVTFIRNNDVAGN